MSNAFRFLVLMSLFFSAGSLYGQDQNPTDEGVGQATNISEADGVIIKAEAIETAWKAKKFDEIGAMADEVRVQAIRGLALDRSSVTRTLVRQSASSKSLGTLLGFISNDRTTAKRNLTEADRALKDFDAPGTDGSYFNEASARLISEVALLGTFSTELEQVIKTQGSIPNSTQSPRVKEIASELNGNRNTSLGFSDDEQARLTAATLKARIDTRIKEAGDERLELSRQAEASRKALFGSLEEAAKREAELRDTEKQLNDKYLELQRVGLKLEELLIQMDEVGGELLQTELGDKEYTIWATIIFGGLVLVVIAGFFWIAIQTDGVSTAIFGGDRGIQFITLFSLVIAIILFGILGILESKELSALLGGLSGYILGKSSATSVEPMLGSKSTQAPASATPPTAPA